MVKSKHGMIRHESIFTCNTFLILCVLLLLKGNSVASTLEYPEKEISKWVIVFYQIVLGKEKDNIEFSGLKQVSQLPNTGGHTRISRTYHTDQKSCESVLKRYKGENKVKKVPSFYSQNVYILTSDYMLSNESRVIINAFQCMEIF